MNDLYQEVCPFATGLGSQGFLENLISTEIQNFKQNYEKNEQYLCHSMNLADLCFSHTLDVKLDHQNIFELI